MPAPPPSDPARSELRRSWPVVAAAFIGIMTGAWALPLFLLGSLMAPLHAAFGWSVAEVAASAAFLAAGTTLGTPLIGLLADRVAPRRLAVASVAIFAAILVAIASVDGVLWHFHALWFLLSLLGVGSGGMIYTRAIGAAFRRQRGLALGIALSGTGAAAFAIPLAAQALLPLLGWRGTVLAFAGVVALVALPLVVWGLQGAGAPAGRERAAPSHGMTRAAALRDARFWALLASVAIFGLCVAGLVVHIAPMLTAGGLSAATAASIASLLGVAIFAGRLGVGWLLDRLPPAALGAAIFAVGALGALAFVTAGPAAAPLTVATIGLLLGAEVDLLSFLTLRYFGNRHYGAIYGPLFAGYSGCGMASPLIASALTARGGYPLLYTAAAGAFGVAALLMLWLAANDRVEPPPPHIQEVR